MCSPSRSDDEVDDALIDPYADEYDSAVYLDFDGTSAGNFTTSPDKEDPETLDYECLEHIDVERLLNEAVEKICSSIPVTPALAKILLHTHKWNVDVIIDGYKKDFMQFLVDAKLKPQRYNQKSIPTAPASPRAATFRDENSDVSLPSCSKMNADDKAKKPSAKFCPICLSTSDDRTFLSLACGHLFCLLCWRTHITVQMDSGLSTTIECMDFKCRLLIPEDFVLKVLQSVPVLRRKYEQLVFQDLVKDNPDLRFCPGPDCEIVIHSRQTGAFKVTCKSCRTTFCFLCGNDYHAPVDCEMTKKWLTKCADDSETANYMAANTKDCPYCHVCIEKSGGCNHMLCAKCKHHFCWMCLGDWKNHGSEYYECSRYKENPNAANETVHNVARKALEKYLFYFERWENHKNSLKLECSMFEKIKSRIDEKVNNHEGTWIDWQYLYDAAALLTKCRHTLQYTYPYAYYMPTGPKKELFEYQQAQLESEIENLSWKVERAENTDRGDMERQMHVAELKRQTLLKDFSATL